MHDLNLLKVTVYTSVKHNTSKTNVPVYVCTAFISYGSCLFAGIYQCSGLRLFSNHAVKIIGWGIDEGVHYWLCVNSWNTHWGDDGFFKVARGNNDCGIASYVVVGRMEAV